MERIHVLDIVQDTEVIYHDPAITKTMFVQKSPGNTTWTMTLANDSGKKVDIMLTGDQAKEVFSLFGG